MWHSWACNNNQPVISDLAVTNNSHRGFWRARSAGGRGPIRSSRKRPIVPEQRLCLFGLSGHRVSTSCVSFQQLQCSAQSNITTPPCGVPSRRDMETCYYVAPLSSSWRHAASIRSCDLSHFPRNAVLASPVIAPRPSSNNANDVPTSTLNRSFSERGPNPGYRDPPDLDHARHLVRRSNLRSDEANTRTTRRPFGPGKYWTQPFSRNHAWRSR